MLFMKLNVRSGPRIVNYLFLPFLLIFCIAFSFSYLMVLCSCSFLCGMRVRPPEHGIVTFLLKQYLQIIRTTHGKT